MGKRGQFYLIAALIIVTIIAGVLTFFDYSQRQEFVGIDSLADEIKIESGNLLDFLTHKRMSSEEPVKEFVSHYENSADGLYFIFGNERKACFIAYNDTEVRVYFIQSSGTIHILPEGEDCYATLNGTIETVKVKLGNISEHEIFWETYILGKIIGSDGVSSEMGYVRDIYFENDLIYVAFEPGVQILNVSDPTNPTALDFIVDNSSLLLGRPASIYFKDGLVYTSSLSEHGVQILNVSDPNNIVPLGNIVDNESLLLKFPHSIYVVGDYAYVASYNDWGVQILNVSDPNNIVPLANYRNSSGDVSVQAYDVFVKEGLAYVASGYGVLVLNVSDPSNPFFLNHFKIGRGSQPFHLYIDENNFLYVSDYSGSAFWILNISNPNNITLLGGVDSVALGLEYAVSVSVSGDLALVSSIYSRGGVQILNVSDPNNIVPLGSSLDDNGFLGLGKISKTYFVGNLIYAAAFGLGGLYVLEIRPRNIIHLSETERARVLKDTYDFRIKEGRNFYFILSEEIGGEKFIISEGNE